MEIETNSTTTKLKDLILRRKINLSQKSWDQLNNRWHDELFTKQNTISITKQDTKQDTKPITKPITKQDSIPEINYLETKIIELKIKIKVLSIINIGFVILYLIK